MIEVEGLTRYTRDRPAVLDVSFTVRRGQALGLVGPDGPARSTILRVLAGLITPTSGRVVIAGYDVRTRSREARRHVGYVPVRPPVDREMRVEPYLRSLCELRGVAPGLRRARIDAALERCGLGDHRRAVIGGLPDDLRLRAGLAQAVVHEPDVLVLDEPGADHELIRELGGGRAVVLSARNAAGVSEVCGRVLVVAGGRVVESERPDGRSDARCRRQVVAVVRGDGAAAERHVSAVRGVSAVAVEDLGEGRHRLTATGEAEDLQDEVARAIIRNGLRLEELSTRRPGPGEAG